MSQHKHIVIATSEFPPQPGGIGNHAYNLALNLSQNNFEVTVIADVRSEDGIAEDTFDKTLGFTVKRIPIKRLRFLMYFKRIWLTISQLKNASYVIATGKFSLWSIAFCSFFFKCQTLAVIHGTEVNFKSGLKRVSINASLKRFDKVIAVSNYTKDFVAHLRNDMVVIPNGIAFSDWQIDSNDKKELKGSPVLTTVGRVSSRKGQLNVIKLLPELIKIYPNVHYHCIGIPTEAEDFRTEAKNLNVLPYITFHGSVSDKLLKQMLNATDIFIMLSTESKTGDVEGFGIALLEANALGVPVIGSKGCGIEDAIDSRNSGLLIEADNSKQFTDSIADILQHKAAYQNKAQDWAKKHDWTLIIQQYIEQLV